MQVYSTVLLARRILCFFRQVGGLKEAIESRLRTGEVLPVCRVNEEITHREYRVQVSAWT